jgi:hypothetical protein
MSNIRINSTNTAATGPQAPESKESAQQSTASSVTQEPQLTQPEEKATPAEVGRQTFEAFLGGNIRATELNAQLPETQSSAAELQQPDLIMPDALDVEQNTNLRSNEALQPGDANSVAPDLTALPDDVAFDPIDHPKGPSAWPPPQDWKPGKTY